MYSNRTQFNFPYYNVRTENDRDYKFVTVYNTFDERYVHGAVYQYKQDALKFYKSVKGEEK